jgi:acetyl-CoA carboxylase alpha subunit
MEMYITKTLNELKNIDVDTLLASRYNKITSIGSPVSLGV